MKALLLVDVQNDFFPGGALPAPQANKILPIINKLMDKFPVVYASQDWHPMDTIHFKKWPSHCIQQTEGAKLHPALKLDKIHQILLKGTRDKDEGYSAFEATNIDFESSLKQKNIDELYVAGLTTEYCVLNSVKDSVKKGFKTYVIEDAIEGVREEEGDVEDAIGEMKRAGALFIQSDELI